MNQQEMFYGGAYASTGSHRSPSTTRPGYGTTSGLPGSNRPNRQLDPIGQHSPSLYGDDRFAPYDAPPPRHNRFQPQNQGFPDGFMLHNNQTWNYNGGAATVNGAMGEGGRLRGNNRRAQIPTEWTSVPEQQPLGGQGILGPNYQGQGLMNQPLGLMSGGLGPDRHGYQNNYSSASLRGMDDKNANSDLIPTAIVIKNIPFNIRKETLTQLMTDMCLPQPYAFNYHFDQGVFRGLAFANFQSAEDTATVIEKMNGLDVQGRKLRVEYKKMLPEHERERIEREKREKRGQLEEQHRTMPLHHQPSLHSLTNASNNGQRNSPLQNVDLNNPETLTYYTELTLFRNDPNREILVFPNSIAPTQRRTIHILAHNMGLEHSSAGEGQHRQLRVIKNGGRASPIAQAPIHLPPGVSLDAHRRGLSRAATIDFAESRLNNAGNYHTVGRQGHPMLELPGSPEGISGINGLRGVKSFADLPRFGDYSTGLGQGSALTSPTTPGGGSSLNPQSGLDASSLLTGMGSMSLGGYDAVGSQMRPRDAPGAIGSQRPGMNGSSTRVNAPERQPRGPGEWDATGFGGRARANGHMQRGSDSSENAVRAAGAGPSSASVYH